MPAKKAQSKRGKTAPKVETKTDSEELKQTKDQSEQEHISTLNTTFTVEKTADGDKSGHSSSDGEGAENAVSKKEGPFSKLGNGDAQELDKIEEADEEDVRESPKAKPKGRGAAKKQKRAEPEFEPKEEQIDEENTATASPKRPREEDSQDEKAEEIPAKRGRGKGEKKAPAPKKQPKAKAEREVAADDGGEDGDVSAEETPADIADEIASSKRGRGGNVATTNKKIRKGKTGSEAEPSEKESTASKSNPEEDSPVEMDDGESVTEVVKEVVKPTKKRAAVRTTKEKTVPLPTTRATRSRKVVTYEEPTNEEDESEEETKKKPKKAATKKASGQAKKTDTIAPKAGTKRKGRALKTAPKEEDDDEADE